LPASTMRAIPPMHARDRTPSRWVRGRSSNWRHAGSNYPSD
jgi:hypothetical protein